MGKRGPQEKLGDDVAKGELLSMLALGIPHKEMARLLGVSVATVGNQLRRLRAREPELLRVLDLRAGTEKDKRCAPGRRPGVREEATL